MNGFERELKDRVLSVISHGEFEGVRGPIEEWQSVITQAEKHPKVEAAAPFVKLTALAEKGQQLKAIEVRGIDPSQESKVSNLNHYIDSSVWQQFKPGSKQVILGQGVADLLNVDVGDFLTLMIPSSGVTTKVQAPKRVRVQVAGLLTLNGQIDHNLALVPLADAQQYAKLGSAVSGVALKVTDVLDATQIVREAGNTLDVYVYLRSWQQKYGFLYRDIQLVRTIMYLVMVLVIGVASFNIVSTLMMAVKDRASEIAILRTMGATDGLVKRIFVWQGVFSGVLGSIVGSVFGVLVALNLTDLIKGLEGLIGHKFLSGDIYFVDFLPSQVNFTDVALVSTTAIILSLLATWYPASRASKLNPAAVLSSK
jgi:lipoprotein-releasing system permease protein